MLADFQICISVPLSELDLKNRSKLWLNIYISKKKTIQ